MRYVSLQNILGSHSFITMLLQEEFYFLGYLQLQVYMKGEDVREITRILQAPCFSISLILGQYHELS